MPFLVETMWLDFSTQLVTVRPVYPEALVISARRVSQIQPDGRREALTPMTTPPFVHAYALRPEGPWAARIQNFVTLWSFEIERHGPPVFLQFGKLCEDWIVEVREGRESLVQPYLRLVLDDYNPEARLDPEAVTRSVWDRLLED